MRFIIDDILDYIQKNVFISDLRIEDVAVHFGYDKYYFSSEFKKITGYSLSEYISSIKAEKAIDMINSEKNIIAIQSSVGYSSAGSFSTIFKKYTGSSPKQYMSEMDDVYFQVKNFEDSEFKELDYCESHNTSFCNVSIDLPNSFKSGIIFIGLFRTPIPNHKPISGIATKKATLNKLKNIPEGDYYLLACAIDSSSNILSYFKLKNCLRGKINEKLSFPECSGSNYTIKLRPPIPEDPPILINVAKLLVSVFRKDHNVE
jgi:AraC-like DNA-binding protein